MHGCRRPSAWRLAFGYGKVTHTAKSFLLPHQLPGHYTRGQSVSSCQDRTGAHQRLGEKCGIAWVAEESCLISAH
ncbi:hypothetical protein LEMLEM_LOCUS13308 [Lemmus lemmus]